MNGVEYAVTMEGDLWEGVVVNARNTRTHRYLDPLQISLPQLVTALGLRSAPETFPALTQAAQQLSQQVMVVDDVTGPVLRVLSRRSSAMGGMQAEALGRVRQRLHQDSAVLSGKLCVVTLLEGVRRSSSVRDLMASPNGGVGGFGAKDTVDGNAAVRAARNRSIVVCVHDVMSCRQHRVVVAGSTLEDVLGTAGMLQLTTQLNEGARRKAFEKLLPCITLKSDDVVGTVVQFDASQALTVDAAPNPEPVVRQARARASRNKGPPPPPSPAHSADPSEEGSDGATTDDDGGFAPSPTHQQHQQTVKAEEDADVEFDRAIEEEAATSIQAVHRGRRTRKELQVQRARQNAAAARIQALQRGASTRQHLFEEAVQQEEEMAATQIQSTFRGHQARRDTDVVRMRSVVQQRKDIAAVLIQSGIRGWLGRLAARRHKMRVVKHFMELQKMHLSAAIIQSFFFRKMYPDTDEEDASLLDDQHLMGSVVLSCSDDSVDGDAETSFAVSAVIEAEGGRVYD